MQRIKKSDSDILRTKDTFSDRITKTKHTYPSKKANRLLNPSQFKPFSTSPAFQSINTQSRFRSMQITDPVSSHESIRLVRYFYQEPQKLYKEECSVKDYMQTLQKRLSDYNMGITYRSSNPIFKTSQDTTLTHLFSQCRRAQKDLRPLKSTQCKKLKRENQEITKLAAGRWEEKDAPMLLVEKDVNRKLSQGKIRLRNQLMSSIKPYYLENC